MDTRRGYPRVVTAVLVCLCSLVGASGSACAAEPVFGPKTYYRSDGDPLTATDTFTVADPAHAYWLLITNGEGDAHRVCSGTIWLNGVEVVSPSACNQQVGSVKRWVTLAAHNTIAIELSSDPDTFLSLEVMPVDSCSDMVIAGPWHVVRDVQTKAEYISFSLAQLHNPYTLAIVNGEPDGSFRVTSAMININGQEIAGQSEFSQQVAYLEREVVLQEQNVVEIIKENPPGAHLSITVLGDDVSAPVIDITEPATGTITKSGFIAVKGTIDDNTAAVTVDGLPAVMLDSNTFFISNVPLTTGDTTITAAAADLCGNSASDSITVTLVPLTIEIMSPAEGAQLSEGPITVTGTVSRSTARVTVNGVAAVVEGTQFTAAAVPLVSGSNTIVAVADDRGDSALVGVTVTVMNADVEALLVELIPADDGVRDNRVSGQVAVTIMNHGSEITIPYQIVAFEDRNLSRAYEEGADNPLGAVTVRAGHPAGGSIDEIIEFAGELLFLGSPMWVQVDSTYALEEIDETNNLISTARSGFDVTASQLRVDESGCPAAVTLTGRIGNAGSQDIAPGLPVAFFDGDPESGGTLLGVAATTQRLLSGQYEEVSIELALPQSGLPRIVVEADRHSLGSGSIDEIDEINNRAAGELPICTGPSVGANSICGSVIDAVSGDALAGTEVSLYTWNGEAPGTLVDWYTTEAYGWFCFTELAAGSYIMVSAPAGYIRGERVVALTEGNVLTRQDLVLSSVLQDGEIRIVLTWGEEPEDLEAHLTAPNPEGCRYHCCYWDRTISDATLDTDDRDSYGPETITISQRTPGTYRYYVHNWTDRNSWGSSALARSGAEVRVYGAGAAPPLVFHVPSEPGTVWHVCDIDGTTGAVTVSNRMTHQSDPGTIDFPRITSQPITSIKVGETYQYQVEAEDPDGDPLTCTLLQKPEGMVVNGATGLIEWTPAWGQGGTHTVQVRVSDGRCGEAMQQFTITLSYLPLIQFAVEPCSGCNPGGDITLTWSTERADTCSISSGIGQVPPSGSMTLPSPAQPIAYVLTASNAIGNATRSAPEKPVILSFGASPACVMPGAEVTLSWSSRCATHCTLSGPGPVDTQGSIRVPVLETSRFTLTASNGAGSEHAQMSVSTDPFVKLDGAPTCTWNPGDPVTLRWSSAAVTSCSIDNGIGEVALDGSMVVYPTEATTYMLTGEQDGKKAWSEVQIPASPRIEAFSSSATHLTPGQSVVLTWETDCGDVHTIDQGIGEVRPQGSLTITPPELPITYTLRAANEWGAAQQQLSLKPILPPAPIASLSASPGLLKSVGESSVLTWTVENATSCSIDQGIGPVALQGSIVVTPQKTTTYHLTAKGPGGMVTKSVTVTFLIPSVSITAAPDWIGLGESSTLTWVIANADAVVLSPGIGEVDPGESALVSPTWTTLYTISATGPGGTAKASANVTVLNLRITAPDPQSITTVNTPTIAVQGLVADPAASVRVNEIAATVQPDGTFQAGTIPLAEGANTITATAQRNGKNASASATVYYQPKPPLTVEITGPPHGAVVHTPTVTVSGLVNDNTATVTVNGIAARVSHGTFTANDFALQEGANTIIARAERLGEVVTAEITVTLTVLHCLIPDTYPTIQAALDAAQPGDVIAVCPGTYQGLIDFKGKRITLISRDGPEVTVLDGARAGSVVTFSSGETSEAVLSGFTITNGKRGIYCSNASPTIENCMITGNDGSVSGWGGAGIYCYDHASPAIRDCTIVSNSAGMGGGVYGEYYSNPSFVTCTISRNSASYVGGLCLWYESSALLQGCTISENQSTASGSDGGGVYIGDYNSLRIENSSITNNVASDGGGICCWNGTLTLINSVVAGNQALGGYGGGIFVARRSTLTILNSTIADNAAGWGDGLYFGAQCTTAITNAIVWDDEPLFLATTWTVPITYSDVKGGYPGIGNINADPLFVDAAHHDYHLQAGSPCIDSGMQDGAPEIDIDGEPRPMGTEVDIGADEFFGCMPLAIEIIEPVNGAILHASATTVSGTVSDSTASVTVNGSAAIVANETFTAEGVTLTEGENTLTATAVRGEETVSRSVTVTYQVPAFVRIEHPADGTRTYDQAVTVSGSVAPAGATVTVNGIAATVADSLFTVEHVPLTEGSNTLTAQAHYGGSTAAHSILVTYENPFNMAISAPIDGENLELDETLVMGTITSVFPEFLVEVNGEAAELNGQHFIVSGVSLQEGANVITTTALDSEGHRSSIQITVNVAEPYHCPIELRTDVQSGTAPLEIQFFLDYDYPEVPAKIVSAAMDWEGDGVNDSVPAGVEFSHTYAQEGIYFPTATLIDESGTAYQMQTYVSVIAMPPLMELWDEWKAKIIAGDLEGALAHIEFASRDKYRVIFDLLRDQLPGILSDVQLEFVSLRDRLAEFRLVNTEEKDGRIVEMEYALYFTQDAYGKWMIESF